MGQGNQIFPCKEISHLTPPLLPAGGRRLAATEPARELLLLPGWGCQKPGGMCRNTGCPGGRCAWGAAAPAAEGPGWAGLVWGPGLVCGAGRGLAQAQGGYGAGMGAHRGCRDRDTGGEDTPQHCPAPRAAGELPVLTQHGTVLC